MSTILVSGFGLYGRLEFVLVTVLPTVFAGLAYAYYDYHLHATRDGQTLGKQVLGLRLVTPDGGPLRRKILRKRAVLYPGVLVLVGLLGVVSSLDGLLATIATACSLAMGISVYTDLPLRRALHDRWARTLVVKVEPADE